MRENGARMKAGVDRDVIRDRGKVRGQLEAEWGSVKNEKTN